MYNLSQVQKCISNKVHKYIQFNNNNEGGVAHLEARLTRIRWRLVSREFEFISLKDALQCMALVLDNIGLRFMFSY